MLAEVVKREAELEGQVKALEEELAFLRKAYDELKTTSERKLARLEHMLKEALRRIYGRRSEKADPNQLVFPFFELADEACRELEAEAKAQEADAEALEELRALISSSLSTSP